MKKKQIGHAEPALQEVHEWREKVFDEVKDLPATQKAGYLNRKADEILKGFKAKKKKTKVS